MEKTAMCVLINLLFSVFVSNILKNMDVFKVGVFFFFNFFLFPFIKCSHTVHHIQSFLTEVSVTGTSLKLEGLTVHGCPRPRPSGSRHIRVQLHINIVHKHSTLHMTLH